MTRLRCVTMQRDETARLEGWLSHHGYLVGFENLTVFDNGSTSRLTIEILRRFAGAGVRVIWEHRSDADFAARHVHVDNLAGQWAEPGLTLGLMLECDERLAVFSTHGLSCARSELDAYLEGPFATAESFTIELGLVASEDEPGYFSPEPLGRRVLVRGEGPPDATRRPEDLTLLSLRAVPGAPILVGLPSWTNTARALELEEGRTGPADAIELRLPAARKGRRRRSAAFDGAAYLALNPDVAAAGWPALKHYLMRGQLEGRQVGPAP